jgi:hypothetical protein
VFHLTSQDWQFCLRWTIATTAAIALCNALSIIGLFSGPIVLAIAQGWAMRPYWPHYRWWGLATIIGGYFALFTLLALVLLSWWPVFVRVFVCGAIAALPHMLVLRHYRQPWRWWPLINAAILTLSLFWFMPDVINAAIYGNSRGMGEWLALATLTGLIGGSLKGFALTQVLRSR